MSGPAPVCDLVLLSWNRADVLVPCVERLLRHTALPSRLLIVDNASTDRETLAYLERVQGTAWMEVAVLRRSKNEGYAVGMNDGLRHTSSPWICLLNNDILVTDGWLAEMLRVAEANPQIGLLNPMSNEFSVGPTQPGPAIDAAARARRGGAGRWLETCVGVGFCVLLPRDVFEQIGYFDERFRFMYFEDRDYSWRVRQAGFICAIAEGAYVYHHRRSGIKQNPALEAWMWENEERFYQKWPVERPRRIAGVLSDRCLQAPETTRARFRALANAGHGVWVYTTPRNQVCVPRHFEVRSRQLTGGAWRLQTLIRVLTKKKGFHRMVVYDRGVGRLLQALRPLHRAEVIVQDP
jgi:GT2 family glycosyltransferase